MTKALRKAIMRRSVLKNKYYSKKSLDSEISYKKQKNYTNRLLKKEKKKYFKNLDVKSFTDNKKFWNTVKPLFSNYSGGSQKITLVNGEKIISKDEEVAKTFNEFFIESVKSLNITENNDLLTNTGDLNDPVEIALKKFNRHPSIIKIKENVTVESNVSFSRVNLFRDGSGSDESECQKNWYFYEYPCKCIETSKGNYC